MTEQKETETTDNEASGACGCGCDSGDVSKMAEMMSTFCSGKEGDCDCSGMMAKMKDCFAEKTE
jgi:hypothetical protein